MRCSLDTHTLFCFLLLYICLFLLILSIYSLLENEYYIIMDYTSAYNNN